MTNLVTLVVPRGKIAGLCIALSLAVGTFPENTSALADPQSNVRGFYDALLTTMRNGPTLGQSGRYARLAPVVDRVFDVPSMTRLAIGSSWAALSPAQQQQLVEAFRHYIAATYADRFDSYSGQQLQVTGERPNNGDVVVQTKIVKSDGDTTTLDYLMRQNQGSWQVSDVYFDGTISQVAIQRSEFYSILRRDGVDGLVIALNRKVDLLGRGVAKAWVLRLVHGRRDSGSVLLLAPFIGLRCNRLAGRIRHGIPERRKGHDSRRCSRRRYWLQRRLERPRNRGSEFAPHVALLIPSPYFGDN